MALEIGSYVGYSAVRIGSQLAPGCKLYSIEFNADNAEVARGMVKHAGLEQTVQVITGTLGTTAEVCFQCQCCSVTFLLTGMYSFGDCGVRNQRHKVSSAWEASPHHLGRRPVFECCKNIL